MMRYEDSTGWIVRWCGVSHFDYRNHRVNMTRVHIGFYACLHTPNAHFSMCGDTAAYIICPGDANWNVFSD